MRLGWRDGILAAAALALFVWGMGLSPVLAQQAGATVEIASPLDYQVFQRETRLRGTIRIQGRAVVSANAAEVRVSGRGVAGALPARWEKLSFDAGSGEFHSDLNVGAGGFYEVDVRLLRGSQTVAEGSVPHVGVGEVFVVSGQSNSTNYGEVAQKTQTGMVTTFDGEAWRVADDPQPGVQDGSKKGSFIPSFGDALYRKYGVPIGIASVGHGSTSVRQWLPAGEPVEVMPTMTKFVVKGADGTLTSDGTLFNGMMARIRQLGVHGFRAVLWHQGESDSHQAPEHEIDAATYRRMLEHVIEATRSEAGWRIPWFVAEASYHTPQDMACPPVREAQRSLWASGVALEGPDTDTLTGQNRQNNGTGTHFSDAGLKAHGLLWATAVEKYLDVALR
jgi:hypothetical protein